MPRLTNDNAQLVPRTSFDGPELRFDFPGLEIGVAEYDEGPTGCTVFHFPGGPAACSIDIRGGSPAVSGAGIELVEAVCFAGGSLYGLEAAAGVAAELLARREYRTGWLQIPLVAGAIIFDWGPRDNAVYPDKELGRAALRSAAAGSFPLGRRGAGRSATAGKLFAYDEREPAGQGGAFRRIGATGVAVFTGVNAMGAIVDGGEAVRLRRERPRRPGRGIPPYRSNGGGGLHGRERDRRDRRPRRECRPRPLRRGEQHAAREGGRAGGRVGGADSDGSSAVRL